MSYGDEKENTFGEIVFSQGIRLYDLFFFSPFLIFLGVKGSINNISKYILFFIATSSIVYNAYYYFKTKEDD